MVRVVLVDDAKFVRNLVKKYLCSSKFEIVGEADNGRDGISLANEKRPDLVISDITMGELDGVEAMKITKKKYPDIKFLICSARMDMHEESLASGADGFLQKPFDEASFLKKVNEII